MKTFFEKKTYNTKFFLNFVDTEKKKKPYPDKTTRVFFMANEKKKQTC